MVKIDGYSRDALLALPAAELDAFVLMSRPVVVKIGSQRGNLRIENSSLSVGVCLHLNLNLNL
jgi:hypothetical protein